MRANRTYTDDERVEKEISLQKHYVPSFFVLKNKVGNPFKPLRDKDLLKVTGAKLGLKGFAREGVVFIRLLNDDHDFQDIEESVLLTKYERVTTEHVSHLFPVKGVPLTYWAGQVMSYVKKETQ